MTTKNILVVDDEAGSANCCQKYYSMKVTAFYWQKMPSKRVKLCRNDIQT